MEDTQISEEEITRQRIREQVDLKRARYRRGGLIVGIISAVIIVILMAIKDIEIVDLILFAVLPAVVIGASIFIAWKWEFVGGIILFIEGLFSAFYFDIPFRGSSFVPYGFIFWIIPACPLLIVAGILFLRSRQIGRRLNEQQNLPPRY